MSRFNVSSSIRRTLDWSSVWLHAIVPGKSHDKNAQSSKSLSSAGNTWDTPLTCPRSTVMHSHVKMTFLKTEFVESWLGG